MTNKTDTNINVSIQHFGPIEWRNGLKPGETVEFDLASVWYTVEVVEGSKDGSKDYTAWQGVWKNGVCYGAILGLAPVAIGLDVALVAGAGSASATTTLLAGLPVSQGATPLAKAAVVATSLAVGGAPAVGGVVMGCMPKKVSEMGVYAPDRPCFDVVLLDDELVLRPKEKRSD